MPPLFFIDRYMKTPVPPIADAIAEGARQSGRCAVFGFASREEAAEAVGQFPRYVRAKQAVVITHVAIDGEEPKDLRFVWEQRSPKTYATHAIALFCRRPNGPTVDRRLSRFLKGLAEMGFVRA